MSLWLRLAAIIVAISVILWLPIEDVGVRNVLIYSAAINAWWAARFILKIAAQTQGFIIRHIIIGMLASVAVSPLALLLMAFKSGIHGHSVPDFTFNQMQAVLVRTPIWMTAGFLLALAVAIARLAWRES